LQEFISEWASPDFHQFVQQPFLWLLFVTLGVAGLSKRRIDGSDLVSVVGFAYLALLARRNYGPFAMVAAPVLSRYLYALLKEWGTLADANMNSGFGAIQDIYQRFRQRSPSPQASKIINVLILVVLGLVALLKLFAVTEPGFVNKQLANYFPIEAVKWVKENQPAGEIFNEYDWGGYLTWELRDYPVFVDGRTDLFADEVLSDYLNIYSGRPGWETVLDSYNINFVMVSPDANVLNRLKSDDDWSLMYRDDLAYIFSKEKMR
jgi:hypothetical protein